MDTFLNLRKIHLRITTNDTLDTIENFVKHFTKTYLISQEDPTLHCHYHILMEYQNDDEKNSKLRYALKKAGYSGSGKYSISVVRNRSNLMKYLLKDNGVYVKSNIPDSVIELMKKCAFKKATKGKYTQAVLALEQKFLGNEINFMEFKIAHIELKISYNQSLYPNHLRGYFNLMKCKSDPMYIKEFITDIVEK